MTEQFTTSTSLSAGFGGDVVWRPTPEYVERAHLTAFIHQHGIKDFDELMSRSIADVAWFTDAVLSYLDIQFYESYSEVLDISDGIQFPKWCVDGKMNIVHNCVDKYQVSGVRDQVAVAWEGEEGTTKSLTYENLYQGVNR